MDVIKWIRRNDRKLMAIVVIVILFGFIGGGELLELLARSSRKLDIGRFDGGRRITNQDLMDARSELELLANLGIPRFLRSQIRTRPPNLYGVLIAELLFGERRPDPELANYLGQVAMSDQYRITDRDLTAVYKKEQPAALYWFLLTYEAQKAGIMVPQSRAARLLGQILPNTVGVDYGQAIQRLISSGIPERQVLRTFAKLMAVLQYCHVVCSMEDLTCQQVDHLVCWDREVLDMNAVVLDADSFTALVDTNLPDSQLAEQLERYNGLYPGQVTKDNPFGFGYKIPARVQLEYMILKVDQIAATIPRPTMQQAEEYYHRNLRQMFTRTVRQDPNDPNSPTKEVAIPFAEVADQIEANWIAEKAREKARAILQEARAMADVGLPEQGQAKFDPQLSQKVTPYAKIAPGLKAKYKFDLYVGTTGLLTLEDLVRRDPYLGMLTVSGRAQWPLPIGQLVFAVEPINLEDLGTIGIQRPMPWETLGPAQEQRGPQTSGEVMATLRVTDAVGPIEPNVIDYTYDNTPSSLEPNQPRRQFMLRDRLAQDLARLRAYHMARDMAHRLADLVKEQGWQAGLGSFNRQFRIQSGSDPNGPDRFAVRTQSQQNMVFTGLVQQYLRRGLQEPLAMEGYRNVKAQKLLTDRLYSLVSPDANELVPTPAIVESEATMRVYCIKDLSIHRYDADNYAKAKGIYAYQEDFIQTQTMAVAHLDPANILRRTRFEATGQGR